MAVRRPEFVLGGALVVCLPMVPGVLNGSISTTSALVRLLGALLVCWALGSVVQNVIDRYAEAAARREFEVQVARARAQRAEAAQQHADREDAAGPSAPA